MNIRVRIAPSPTGFLHIGTARTALFNYLFTKHHGGQFIVRIEDTDLERSDVKYEKDIIENLRWLGMEWDEGPVEPSAGGTLITNEYRGKYGPYRQSERTATYTAYLQKLLDESKAYYCYCSKEELEEERQAMLAQGLPPKYSGRCRARGAPPGQSPQLIRFKVPEKKISFHDMIRGEITFETAPLGDIAIAKSLTTPLYNFVVVIDDHEMHISHVIRGEDHIPNTPKQILLQEALGFRRPHYAHLPLILDPDRAKMSKRYSATAVHEYRDQGYVPEALVNYLALLGWHPGPEAGGDRELFSLAELVRLFDVGRVQKAGAIFNAEKLNWLNSQYLRELPAEELARRIGIEPTPHHLKIISIVRPRLEKLTDFDAAASFFFQMPDYPASLLCWRGQAPAEAAANLEAAGAVLHDEAAVRALAEARGRGEVLWPLRVALSGLKDSPSPFELLEGLGHEESLRRVRAAIEKIRAAAPS